MGKRLRTRGRAWALGLLMLGHLGFDCGAPPSVFITSPVHGAFHVVLTDGPDVTVTGQLQCIVFSGAEVRVWWDVVGTDAESVVATIAPSGAFTATLPAPNDGRILHTLIVEARYGAQLSHTRRDHAVVHVVNDPLDVGPGDAGTTIVRVTDPGLDALEPLLSAQAASAFDLSALLVGTDLLGADEPCVQKFLGLCVLRLEDAIVTDAGIAGGDVSLDAKDWGVDALVDLTDPSATIHLVGKLSGIGFTCDAALTTPNAELDVTMDLQDDPLDPSKLVVEQVGSIDLSPLAWAAVDLNCAGVIGGLLGDMLDTVVEDEDRLEALAEAIVTAIGEDDVLEQPFQDALDEIALADAIASPLDMDLGVVLNGDPLDDMDGVSVVSGIHPQPTATECQAGGSLAGQSWACPQLPDDVFNVYPGGNPYVWGDQTPGGATYDAALAFEDTALNLLLRAISEQGKLSQRITSIASCNDPDLRWGCLVSAAGCAAMGLSCSDRVDILVRPAVAPLVRGNPGFGGSLSDLIVQLQLDLVTPGVNPAWDVPRLTMMLTFEAGLDLVVSGNELAFAFELCEPQPCSPVIELHAVHVYFPNPALGPRLIDAAFVGQGELEDVIGDLLANSLASAIQGFPLPEVQGQPFTPIEIDRFGIPSYSPTDPGFITVFGSF